MKTSEITNSINTLPKIGPAKAALFAKLNIFTIADLLQYYPRDYEDRTQRTTLHECMQTLDANPQAKAHTIVQVIKHDWFGYGAMKTLKIVVTDGTASAELIAFNRPWLQNSLKIGSILAVAGVFNRKYGTLQSSQYDTEKLAESGKLSDYKDKPIPNSKVFPIYRQTEGLSSKQISAAVEAALKQYAKGIENDLPESIIEKKGLLTKIEALQKIHLPKSIQEATEARQTLVYEELYLFQRTMA